MKIYQMIDQHDELVGLIQTDLTSDELEKLWEEYMVTKFQNDDDELSIEEFEDIYRFEKDNNVFAIYFEGSIYPNHELMLKEYFNRVGG